MATTSATDSDAQAYFTAGSITDATEKAAANTAIVALKAAGLWTIADRVYLRSPTSLAASLLCCKTLLSQTAFNSPTHSSTGLLFNGTTQYALCDTATNALTNVQATSASIYVSTQTASIFANAGLLAGAQNAAGTINFYVEVGSFSD